MPKPNTQFLPLPSVRLAFREHGSGPPLLFLHGNSGSKATFRQYQTAHFPDFHTFALDSRGHGQSISQDEHLEFWSAAPKRADCASFSASTACWTA